MRRRDIAVEDVPQETAQVPVKFAGKRRVEPQTRSGVEVAHQEIAQRLERADGERRHVWQARRAAGAYRATSRGFPRVRLLCQRLAALRALAELGPEARSIEEMQVEPAADRRRVDARVERAQGGLEEIEERRGRDAVGREAIDELGEVPAGRDEREIVAH